MDKGISQHWTATYTQVDLLRACQEWQSGFIGKSLEHLWGMNQSATDSLLYDKAKPRNITLIQVYGPTTAATDDEMERFYQDLSQAVKQA